MVLPGGYICIGRCCVSKNMKRQLAFFNDQNCYTSGERKIISFYDLISEKFWSILQYIAITISRQGSVDCGFLDERDKQSKLL